MEAKLQSEESNKRLLENLNSQEQHCKLLKEDNQSFAEELDEFEDHLSIVDGKFHSIRAENLEVGLSILNWFNIRIFVTCFSFFLRTHFSPIRYAPMSKNCRVD